jgi:hypothetical protein
VTIELMMRYVKTVGIPTFFALVLLWAFIFRTPAATAEQINTLGVKIDAHQQTADKQVQLLYLVCLNTAGKSQAARDACEAVRK